MTASTAASPKLAGCPVFPSTSVWNKPVNTLPVATNSATLIRSIGLDAGVHADFGNGLYDGSRIGIPYVVVHGKTTPKSKVTFDYADESDKGPYPIPANVPIEGAPAHANEGDRHAIVVDEDSCRDYELYALQHTANGWHAGSGAIFDLRSNKLRPAGWTSADAAGLPILPGLARWDGDASTGVIRHALRFTAERDDEGLHLPRAPLRERLERSVAAAHGAARAAEGERRHLEAASAGPHRRAGDEDLRPDPGRQRLALVRVGRPEPALVERRATRARVADGRRLRGGRHLAPAAVARR